MNDRSPADAALECIDPEIGELLPFHAEGTLPTGDRQLVLAHLAACARCAEEERLMRAVAQGIASLRLDPSPAAALDAVRGRPRWLIGAALGIAAAAALVIALGGGGFRREGTAALSSAEVAALEQRVQQLEARNALLAHQVAREQMRIESPLAGIPIAAPPNF